MDDHQSLERLLEEGRKAFPQFSADEEAIRPLLRARLDAAQGEELHAADLYLACACAASDKGALALFEEHLAAAVARVRHGAERTRALADEVRQLVRERLFVGTRPKIAEYSGRGSLAGWLRVVALRAAQNLRRGPSLREDSLEPVLDAPDLLPAVDPELAIIRAAYRGEFARALRHAFLELPSRDRVLFRMHFLDGLNIDRLAPVFQVHRSTIARWIAAGREALTARTMKLLGERLRLAPAEVQSLLRAVRSSIDVSLQALLAQEPDQRAME